MSGAAIARVVVMLAAVELCVGCDDDGASPPTRTAHAAAASSSLPDQCSNQLLAYFEPDTEWEILQELARQITEVEGVEQVTVLDAAATAADAERLFADDPVTLGLLRAGGVPTSLRVVATDTAQLEVVDSLLSSQPAHLKTIRPDEVVPPEWVDTAHLGSVLARWCDLGI